MSSTQHSGQNPHITDPAPLSDIEFKRTIDDLRHLVADSSQTQKQLAKQVITVMFTLHSETEVEAAASILPDNFSVIFAHCKRLFEIKATSNINSLITKLLEHEEFSLMTPEAHARVAAILCCAGRHEEGYKLWLSVREHYPDIRGYEACCVSLYLLAQLGGESSKIHEHFKNLSSQFEVSKSEIFSRAAKLDIALEDYEELQSKVLHILRSPEISAADRVAARDVLKKLAAQTNGSLKPISLAEVTDLKIQDAAFVIARIGSAKDLLTLVQQRTSSILDQSDITAIYAASALLNKGTEEIRIRHNILEHLYAHGLISDSSMANALLGTWNLNAKQVTCQDILDVETTLWERQELLKSAALLGLASTNRSRKQTYYSRLLERITQLFSQNEHGLAMQLSTHMFYNRRNRMWTRQTWPVLIQSLLNKNRTEQALRLGVMVALNEPAFCDRTFGELLTLNSSARAYLRQVSNIVPGAFDPELPPIAFSLRGVTNIMQLIDRHGGMKEAPEKGMNITNRLNHHTINITAANQKNTYSYLSEFEKGEILPDHYDAKIRSIAYYCGVTFDPECTARLEQVLNSLTHLEEIESYRFLYSIAVEFTERAQTADSLPYQSRYHRSKGMLAIINKQIPTDGVKGRSRTDARVLRNF